MRRGLLFRSLPLVALLALGACKDDGGNPSTDAGGTVDTGGTVDVGSSSDAAPKDDASTPDAKPNDAPVIPPSDGGLVPCLDQPTNLERPPSGQLPCHLLPPGFGTK